MGIFSNIFKRKEKNVVTNSNPSDLVYEQSSVPPLNGETVNQGNLQQVNVVNQSVQPVQQMETPSAVTEPVTSSVNGFPAMINTDPSNVLEQMQNRAVEEAAAEAQSQEATGDPMGVFNQNITLDSDNPMSVFGVDNENNK